MTKYQENFIDTTSFIKKLLKIKMVTLLLGHPVFYSLFNHVTLITMHTVVFELQAVNGMQYQFSLKFSIAYGRRSGLLLIETEDQQPTKAERS